MTSVELDMLITQLRNGCITECEFIAFMQLDERTQSMLNRFNNLDPADQNWNFTFDDFISWKNRP